MTVGSFGNAVIGFDVDSTNAKKGFKEVETAARSTFRNINKAARRGGKHKWNMFFTELSRGVEDFASQIGTTGLAGALRASTNNLNQMALVFGGAGGVFTTFAITLGALVIPHLLKTKEAIRGVTDEMKKAMGFQKSQLTLGSGLKREEAGITSRDQAREFIKQKRVDLKALQIDENVLVGGRDRARRAFMEKEEAEYRKLDYSVKHMLGEAYNTKASRKDIWFQGWLKTPQKAEFDANIGDIGPLKRLTEAAISRTEERMGRLPGDPALKRKGSRSPLARMQAGAGRRSGRAHGMIQDFYLQTDQRSKFMEWASKEVNWEEEIHKGVGDVVELLKKTNELLGEGNQSVDLQVDSLE